ncbi:alpha/beta hydrolase [Mycobacterium sp. CVI_P3]|uniref:Alpha/beta hydrolase n=1 Tax=Mycobacterium pinniadriaticum TaxID=2994102 RepID=A0ABT3S9C3_9MYCO|nr:alpha/beta hydrolase [Mycobacterium pinniadriaticum]MCX2929669.1 alpha/beta hydrolase [Mycobacterium pinniadriaticum]MCX2936093.1 alpha/beta hydrolase [Mycobacterium pinniadriaticum]
MLPASVRQWQEGGRLLSTSAGNVFVRSRSGSAERPAVLMLHGFPSSSYDFRGVVDRLGDRAWLALDFLGFGLSDKPRPHRYSLLEQADIVSEVVADVAPGPVVLLAHDMGTSVATELLARDVSGALPFELQRAVLTNGSVIIERASLRPSQKILRGRFGPLFARLTNERGFLRGFAKLFSAAHPLSADEAEAQWALLARDDGHRILDLLCAYLNERVRFAPRWHGAVRDWDKPLGFLWATGDPVATTEVLAGLRELRPAAEVIELPGIGHYPQIEVPDEFTAGVVELLALD